MRTLASILSRISKREKIVLYAAAVLILLSVLDRLIINPILHKIGTVNKEIEENKAGIKRSLRVLAYKDKIITEITKYKAFLDNYGTEEEQVTSILKEIERLADKESVYLVNIMPRKGAGNIGESTEYSVTLTCEAPMEQIMKFMYDIENSRNLLTIGKYEISPKSKDSNVSLCSMTVSKLVMRE